MKLRILWLSFLIVSFLSISSVPIQAAGCTIAVDVQKNAFEFELKATINSSGLPEGTYKIWWLSKDGEWGYVEEFLASDTPRNQLIQGLSLGAYDGETTQVKVTDYDDEDTVFCESPTITLNAEDTSEEVPFPEPEPAPGEVPPIVNTTTKSLCNQIPDESLKEECEKCPVGEIWTALGCLDVSSASGPTQAIMNIMLGMGGGFAIMFILFGAFTMTTSTGNPERLKLGQQMIVSAIMGLLFIIFSVLILRTIGVQILAIPGFGS